MNQKISIIGTGLLGMSLALAVTQNFSDNNNSLFLWDPHLDSVSIKQLNLQLLTTLPRDDRHRQKLFAPLKLMVHQ